MVKYVYNLFLDDERDPAICTTYSTRYMPQNKRMYSMETWTVARSYEEFVRVISEGLARGEFPVKVSFDHDLADEHYAPLFDPTHEGDYPQDSDFKEKTGNEAAQWLVNTCVLEELELPECWVHSMNSIGAKRIFETLGDFPRFREIYESDKLKR